MVCVQDYVLLLIRRESMMCVLILRHLRKVSAMGVCSVVFSKV